MDEPQPPSSSSRPVLQSSSRFSPSSVASLLNMSNDVVISVSLHLSTSDGKQECGARARAGMAMTDEENGCGQQRMRRVLMRVWMLR